MSKGTQKPDPASPVAAESEMLDEYDFSQGVRGKYAGRYNRGTNIVLLSPDVAAAFPNAESVNEALRALVQVANRSVKKTTETV